MKLIRKVALAVFKDKKLLVVRTKKNNEVFYCLGGTMESGESETDCLVREVMEEIDCEVQESSLKLLAEFEDLAHGREETKVNIRMYTGELSGEMKPSSEVAEIGYFDSTTDKKYLSAIAVNKMFPWLKEKGYIG